MMDSKYSVSWQVYQKNICNGLSFLQQREEFVDMTIAADGHLVKVHRMVMSLVSPYLKELITSAQCPHPVIFLNRVSYQSLQLLLEYAYTGEVLVPLDCIEDFLQVCNILHISGLENVCKPITTIDPTNDSDHDVSQVDIINDTMSSQLSKNTNKAADFSDDDTTFGTQVEQNDDDDDDYAEPAQNMNSVKKAQPEVLDTIHKGTTVQYSISNHGTVQVIFNRYIYCHKYTRKDNSKAWRCVSSKTCRASVITVRNKVVHRSGAHNHPYLDRQILKKVRSNNIFAVEPKDHQMADIKNKDKD